MTNFDLDSSLADMKTLEDAHYIAGELNTRDISVAMQKLQALIDENTTKKNPRYIVGDGGVNIVYKNVTEYSSALPRAEFIKVMRESAITDMKTGQFKFAQEALEWARQVESREI